MRFEGRLKSWNDERGFGFIEPRDGGQDIFVHASAMPTGIGRPLPGQALSFQVELNRGGKKRATNVGISLGERRPRPARRARTTDWSAPSALAIPAFIAVYVAVALTWGVAAWVALAYAALSIVCLFAYAFDKSADRKSVV